jgi:hypothetical protein
MSMKYVGKLLRDVGTGDLSGHVEFDQIYAHWQHEGWRFKHPRGGQAGYLRDALLENYRRYLQRAASMAVNSDGSHIRTAMVLNMESLSNAAEEKAPHQFGNLEKSGHPSVTDKGEIIYDRPPKQHRLTEREIRAERRATGQ